MKSSRIACLSICLILLVNACGVFAFETDQYNLPPVPLADIGDEVSEYTEQNLRDIVAKINAEIATHEACLAKKSIKKTGCGNSESEQKRLDYLRSDAAIANHIYHAFGLGIFPFTWIGKWMNTHKFRGQPARYKTSYLKSIFIFVPTDYLTISPTVNLYGSQFGVDKIEHFFQEGYDYYKIYNRAVAEGATPDDAIKKAVKWGKKSEDTFYGTLVAGVYSNGDLASNYVGLKFYLGLTKPIEVNGKTRPPTFVLKNGQWAFNENDDLREHLIKPFVSDHLNEALNPSIFAFNLLPTVRRVVKKQSCPQWIKTYPGLTKASLEAKTKSLTLWNGEDYGFTDSKKFVTIANMCFPDESQKPNSSH